MNLLDQAKFLATSKHKNLYGDKNYTYHLQQVVTLLNTWRKKNPEINEETFIVGWLHDILEDTSCTYDTLKVEFGKQVAGRVKKLSKNYYSSEDEYLTAVKGDIVKIADTVCNLIESMKSENRSRIKKYTRQLILISDENTYFEIMSNYLESIQKLSRWAYEKYRKNKNE